ncbi:RNA polymerase sigma factor [Metallumcola ferriviriculae]|uniref:RNA polymerase sigma factor n=1 Tax=Metallumcola ferriviriculae TaxID=3039180 RepID=A0AAU0USM0_9FIRM|nr:RNA polymerase sigma factor [Desulfitibacteraceae bacterium MK1]
MLTEKELVEQLKNAEEEAVEQLVERLADRLLRTALAIIGDRQLAEEVVQDTFLQVCRRIGSFKGQSSLETWIYRITVNLAKNRIRGGWFRQVMAFNAGDFDFAAAPPGEQPESIILRDEEREAVISTLKGFPLKYREVLVLYYLEELNIREISAILQQPEGTVKSKLSRARILLKENLTKKEVVFSE